MGDGKTLQDWITTTERRFRKSRLYFGHGTENALDEAAWLVASVAKLVPGDLGNSLSRVTNRREGRRIELLTEKRIESRQPLAYLLGEAWLSGYRFFVDRRVIVPRSFIAEPLCEAFTPWCRRPNSIKRILDLCTGSGCLAILAALTFPKAKVDAADISRRALAVARKNVHAYHLENRVTLVRSDLFRELPLNEYDLIISNPPYVNAQTMRKLPPEYRNEPNLALAGGTDGLDAVVRIVDEAHGHLRAGGHLVIEVGHNRRAFEKRYPLLPVVWLSTSISSDAVLWIDAKQLSGQRKSGRM